MTETLPCVKVFWTSWAAFVCNITKTDLVFRGVFFFFVKYSYIDLAMREFDTLNIVLEYVSSERRGGAERSLFG